MGKGSNVVHGMFYAFVFQDVVHFGIIGEDIVIDFAKAIESHNGASLKHGWMLIMIYNPIA